MDMHESKKKELEAKIEATNLAHAYGNKLRKLLVEFFTPYVGQKIIKADGSLLAKIAAKLPAFPDEKGNPGQHVHASIMTYRHRSDYSLAWTVKTCQPIPPHTCTYYESTVYIGDMDGDVLKSMTTHMEDWKADYTLADIVAKIEAYEAAQKVADDLKGAVYPFSDFVR
jgi:hypothetical protein